MSAINDTADAESPDTTLLDADEVAPLIDFDYMFETLSEPQAGPDGQPAASFLPSVLGSKPDPVEPSRALMTWIALVTAAGLAGPIWAAWHMAVDAHDLAGLAFLACVALTVTASLVPPFEVQRGKRTVIYTFSEIAILISIAIAPAADVIIAGFIALLIRSTQEYINRPKERFRILFNFGLGLLSAWVTVLVATSWHSAPWNYLVAALTGAIVADIGLARVFKVAFELPYRAYFAKDWLTRLGIPSVVALVTGTILMIPNAVIVLTALPIGAIIVWRALREVLRIRSERATWANLDQHSEALTGMANEREIAQNTVLRARAMFPMAECALFIYPATRNRTGGYVVRLKGQAEYATQDPYIENLDSSYAPPTMGAEAVVSAELAYAPLLAVDKVLGHFEMKFSRYQRRTGESAKILGHFLSKTSSTMMMARQHDQMRVFAETKSREAEQDLLTGLGNRQRLYRGGGVALRHARQHDRRAAVMLFDLDGFKRINDTLGHRAGDKVLRVIADRIKLAVGPHDIAARIGGDEFVILAADLAYKDDALTYAKMISELIATVIPLVGISLAVEASVGVAHVDDDASMADLLKQADIAMYAAKDHGRGVAEVYSPEMDQDSPEQLQLTADLRQCMERSELVMHYQPQINLFTGQLVGLEALVRWQHPERGLLYPDTFVPLAESSGMIRPFTLQILDRSLDEFSGMLQRVRTTVSPGLLPYFGDEFTVSVNFSARNLLDLELPEHVRERLAFYGVPANRLVIEVTESANVHDWASAERVMKALSELGCLVSIDDFGTGYSSLKSLMKRKDTVTEVKVDRSFVSDIVTDSGTQYALVQAIVSMAHGTGCQVVAEGVELAETVPALRAMGCDTGQGYYFARPMPASKLSAWIEAWPQAWAVVAPQGVSPVV
ncbi:putative bifunctional diguanylate cyclase/phosphodiesterase [Tessaracoccus sp.]